MLLKKINSSVVSYPDTCCTSPYRIGFVDYLHSFGYSITTVSSYERGVLHLGRWADSSSIQVKHFNEEVIARFRRHLKRCGCNPRNRGKLKPARLASKAFLEYLSCIGEVIPAVLLPIERLGLMTEFRAWMMVHRGISQKTLDGYDQVLSSFFKELGNDPTLWSMDAIRAFILNLSKYCGEWKVKRSLSALRMLLKFVVVQGKGVKGWEAIIPTIPQWKLACLPRYLEPKEVERVLVACNRSTADGLRDYAVLLLLARLGLRAGDVVNLKINDIDWSQATLRVSGKERREIRLPLPQEVGDSILAYIECGRARVAMESVFLCLEAPFRPFATSASISDIVKKALIRANVKNVSWRGAHLLRHSAATAMIREGSTLEAVATLLRHKSIDTTAHYAKVDIEMLQMVTQPWPAGAPC